MPKFEKGMELCEGFFKQAVKPILAGHFQDLSYSAGRLDYGSDVLGFDTPQSMDHGWGPQVTLFVGEKDYAEKGKIEKLLGEKLPFEIHGIPTNFSKHEDGNPFPTPTTNRPIQHKVTVTTSERFFREYLGLESLDKMAETDWLLVSPQRLRTIASGRVFHDGLGTLEEARKKLAWYPTDLWIYLLACQWQKIHQIEPFMARCGDVGDELGSRLLGARLAGELMGLFFLMEKQYAPYSKWFGTAFSQLACAKELFPDFTAILECGQWKEREKRLSEVYLAAIRTHNSLKLTETIEETIQSFHTRPYLVPNSGRIVSALYGVIKSTAVLALPRHIGAVGQFSDSTDVVDSIQNIRKLKSIYVP